jgi:hypothetical protein
MKKAEWMRSLELRREMLKPRQQRRSAAYLARLRLKAEGTAAAKASRERTRKQPKNTT